MAGSLEKAEPRRPRGSFVGAVGGLIALAIVGALATTALSAIYAAADAESVEPTPPLPVAVARLEVVNAYGTVESYLGRVEPARSTALGFERGGEVMEVLVEEGDIVGAGDAIARLDADALEAERDQLLAEKERLEATLALAARTRARQDSLSNDGFSSEQQADEARTAEITTTAQIAAIEAQIRRMEIEIRKSTIRAPFAGVVAARRIDPGAIVSAGQRIVDILEVGRPQARIGLPPERAERLVIGGRYAITVRNRRSAATLAAVRPDLDPATRTVAAIFDLDLTALLPTTTASTGAASDASRPFIAPFGEVARLELPYEVRARGAWVPLSALQEDARGLWRIQLVRDDANGEPVVVASAVEVYYVSDGRAFIVGAIEDGARYVVEGLNRTVIGDVVAPFAAE